MATLGKIRAGYKSKKEGQYFEILLQNHCKINSVSAIKLPEGCRSLGYAKIARVRTPFDFVLSKNNITYFIDTKSVAGKSYNHSAITQHQVDTMFEAVQKGSVSAGYIIHFRSLNKICFFDVKTLMDLKPRESLIPEDGIDMGHNQRMNFDKLFTSV